jgi:uncharacterized protein (TIGR02118 family)
MEAPMTAKLVVLYPWPSDVDQFERAYVEDHVPMVNEKTMPGLTKFVATRIQGAADGGRSPFYRIAELHFPSMAALKECASSEGARKAVAHAVSISSGGAPSFLIAEETTTTYGGSA